MRRILWAVGMSRAIIGRFLVEESIVIDDAGVFAREDAVLLVQHAIAPVMMLSGAGAILGQSPAAATLFQSAGYSSISQIVTPREAERVQAALTAGQPVASLRLRLRTGSSVTLRCEPINIGATAMLLMPTVVHTASRQRIIDTIARRIPALLMIDDQAALFHDIGGVLRDIGGLMWIMEPAMDQHYRLTYSPFHPGDYAVFHALNLELPHTNLAFDPSVYRTVVEGRKTLFLPSNQTPLMDMNTQQRALVRLIFQINSIDMIGYAPLLVGDTMLGVMILSAPGISEADSPVLEQLAAHLAACLAQIQARQQMQRQIRWLDSLGTTARAVTMLTSVDDVLAITCAQVARLFGADIAAIALAASDSQDYSVVMADGTHAHALLTQALPMRIDRMLIDYARDGGQAIAIADLHSDTRLHLLHNVPPNMRCVVLQPLIQHGNVLGILLIGYGVAEQFPLADIPYLVRYAEYAAIALTNAQLHSALVRSEQVAQSMARRASESQRYLNTLIHSAQDVLFTIKPDDTIVALNADRMQAFSGMDVDELDGNHWSTLVPESERDRVHAALEYARSGAPQMIEVSLLRRGGSYLRVRVSAIRLPGYDEIFVSMTDITTQRQLEAEVRRNERLAGLGWLVSGIAHELNNPLNIILGMAQLQQEDAESPELRQDLRTIEQAAQRASQIIRQLRVFAGLNDVLETPFDLVALIGEACERLSDDIARAAATVVIEDAPVISLLGAPNQIEQALYHVLLNAVQAVAEQPPGVPRLISITIQQQQHAVSVAISDTGPGIPLPDQPHVFEPFFTRRPVGQGLGLGLAVTYAIVHYHGGRVALESHPGYTCVTMTLPYQR